MQLRDARLLEHIYNYCLEIEKDISRFGSNLNVFLQDKGYQRSVSFSIFQIGELSGRLSSELRSASPEISWSDMKIVRNIVVHNYGRVDFETIWKIIEEDLPVLKAFCEKHIDNE